MKEELANVDSCIYTGRPATSRDHVPPKSFLSRPYPGNLTTVPACGEYNSDIAKDEQYVLAVFGQIIEHPAIARRVVNGGDIDRTLSRSPHLDDRIINQLGVDDDGKVFIQPEWPRISRVLEKIAAGLFFLKYQQAPGVSAFNAIGLYNRHNPPEDMVNLSWTMKPEGMTDVVQWSIFGSGFCKSDAFPQKLMCNMNFYDTLFGIVRCPEPNHEIE